MTIPALPPLDRTSPTFRTDLDTFFLTQLPATVTALNSELTRIDGITPTGFTGTSTTSLTIASSGTVTLTTQANKGFAAGQIVLVAVTASPATQMQGIVSTYNVTTGELVLTADTSAGSGTYAAWTVSLTTASASPYSVGDIALTNRTLSAPAWLPADGSVYAQSSYAALYAEVGLLRNGLSREWSMIHPALADNPAGGALRGGEAVTGFPLFTHDSRFCCYSKTTGATTHRLNRSSDGTTWTAATMPTTTNDAAYVGFAVIGTTLIAVSPAGDTWVARSTDGGATWNTNGFGITAANGRNHPFVLGGLFVILTGTTAYYTSPDGIVWTARTAPAVISLRSIAGGVAFATTGSQPFSIVYTSTDAVTWTSRSLPVSGGYYEFAHLGGVWLTWDGMSPNGYLRSTDSGATWASHTYNLTVTHFPNGGLTPEVHKGRFRIASAASFSPSIHSSSDGLTWTQDVAPDHGFIPARTFYPRLMATEHELYWFDVGNNYAAWVSSNGGLTWATHPCYSTATGWTNFQVLAELSGVQVLISSSTSVYRRSVYTYNPATQFAVPAVPAPTGVTAYIKA